MEIWKDITGFEGIYQVSDLGRIKSLNYKLTKKEKILKKSIVSTGYETIKLCSKGVSKTYNIHKLVAIAFLNHKPCGYELVVNHKNFIRHDNRVENLEIVTARENGNQKHIKSSSQYVGISMNKNSKNWASKITINGKAKHLGTFKTEEEASLCYQNALIALKTNNEIVAVKQKLSSQYKGVSWNKESEKWIASIYLNGKTNYLGIFTNEIDASNTYKKAFIFHNKQKVL